LPESVDGSPLNSFLQKPAPVYNVVKQKFREALRVQAQQWGSNSINGIGY